MGNREAISKMHNMSAAVLTSVLTLIDEYDLYGQVAYPKHHKYSEVTGIYRLAARTKVSSSGIIRNSDELFSFCCLFPCDMKPTI
jgi:hypothetical protein